MASAFTLIEDTVLGSAAASITFNTGLTDYTKFRLTVFVVKDGTASRVWVRLNGDTGYNYSNQRLSVYSTTAQGARDTATVQAEVTAKESVRPNTAGLITVEISKPLSSVPARMVSSNAIIEDSANAIALGEVVHEWNNTADAISSISVLAASGNLATGTRAVLEGAS